MVVNTQGIDRRRYYIVNGGWHHHWEDNTEYFCHYHGLYNKEAGEWFVERVVKAVRVEQQALDHPLGTAIAAFHQYYSYNCLMDNSRILTSLNICEKEVALCSNQLFL